MLMFKPCIKSHPASCLFGCCSEQLQFVWNSLLKTHAELLLRVVEKKCPQIVKAFSVPCTVLHSVYNVKVITYDDKSLENYQRAPLFHSAIERVLASVSTLLCFSDLQLYCLVHSRCSHQCCCQM